MLRILYQDGVAKPERALKLLDEGVVEEACDRQPALCALILKELCGTSRRIYNQRIAIKALEDDSIFRTKIINWQTMLLPLETLICSGQKFRCRIRCLVLDA